MTLASIRFESVADLKPLAVMVKPAISRLSLLPLYLVKSNNPVRGLGISVLVTATAAASPAMGASSSTVTSSLPVVVP
ncbi:hypothetical protein D3C81_1929550 [compost metagenome]